MRTDDTTPSSLVYATDIDVLPSDRVVERRDGYLVVRSPSNPAHYWGNFLLFDRPPEAGDGARWEEHFAREFGDDPRVRHSTFAWDRTDGVAGAAREEFVTRGYDLEETVGLLAGPDDLKSHPRENRAVEIRELDPARGTDEDLWSTVAELQEADAGDHDPTDYGRFVRARLDDRRAHFRAGRGGWYVALDGASREVAASCGVVVTDGRGRFQAVDTALAFRRRGIASRLVVDAARRATERYGAEDFVIAADADYHALGLYESLGFARVERVFGVCRWPRPGA